MKFKVGLIALAMLPVVAMDNTAGQGVVYASWFWHDWIVAAGMARLLNVVQPAGVRTDALSAALSKTRIHRNIRDTAGFDLTSGISGLTLSAVVNTWRGQLYVVDDGCTHTILSDSDAEAIAHQPLGRPNPLTKGIDLTPWAIVGIHELIHSTVYRTRCFTGAPDAEEAVAQSLTAAAVSKIAMKTGDFLTHASAANAAGGEECLNTLGLYDPVARFTLKHGTLSAVEGQTLATPTAALLALVSVDMSQSDGFIGPITGGRARLDGIPVADFSNRPVLPVAIPYGVHRLTVSVHDTAGFESQTAESTIIVTRDGQRRTTFAFSGAVESVIESGASYSGVRVGDPVDGVFSYLYPPALPARDGAGCGPALKYRNSAYDDMVVQMTANVNGIHFRSGFPSLNNVATVTISGVEPPVYDTLGFSLTTMGIAPFPSFQSTMNVWFATEGRSVLPGTCFPAAVDFSQFPNDGGQLMYVGPSTPPEVWVVMFKINGVKPL